MQVDYYLVSADRRARRLKTGRTYGIGRDPQVDITLQDALISRRHAELRWGDDGWLLVDLNSRNGVLVNGARIVGSQVLADGDQMQLGGQVLNYYLVPPNADLGAISQQAPEISSQVTMAPGISPSDIANSGSSFSGAIEGGLLDLMQFFVMTRKSGRLDLTSRIGCAIWFVDGTPRDASDSRERGFDALNNLVRSPGERFAFFVGETPPQGTTIDGGADGILMELARVMDEDAR
jgi:pSer/pThr/pTyr-binding forkhead associated (FHA) protein